MENQTNQKPLERHIGMYEFRVKLGERCGGTEGDRFLHKNLLAEVRLCFIAYCSYQVSVHVGWQLAGLLWVLRCQSDLVSWLGTGAGQQLPGRVTRIPACCWSRSLLTELEVCLLLQLVETTLDHQIVLPRSSFSPPGA